MNGCIVEAVNKKGDIFYISNTGPILWTGDIKEAKTYKSIDSARSDLKGNLISLASTINYCGIISLMILEYKNNIETRREYAL